MKFNRYLLRSAVVGSLGGLLFGFDTAVIAGATHSLTEMFHLSPFELGVTVASALLGTVLGCILAGYLGEAIGGRDALRIMAVLYFVSAFGCAFAPNWTCLLVFRVVGGLGIGGSSVLGPVYISELAPAALRGRFVGLFQINIVIGILCAYLSNTIIVALHSGPSEWRWELGVSAVPALAFLLFLFGIPNSSRWLVTQGRIDEAREALLLLNGSAGEGELTEIVESVHTPVGVRREQLFQRAYMVPILLAIAIGCFNQLSGVNAILYYMNNIFEAAGFSHLSGSGQAVLVGIMNLVATLIAMTLIDKVGRKTLLLWGSVGTAACLAGVAALFLTGSHLRYLVFLLGGDIFFFALSQGAVIWVYISEIFPNSVRAKGQSLGSFSHWTMNAVVSGIFPIVARRSHAYPFVFFSVVMAIQFFVVLFWFPETKGASLEQLQKKFERV